MATATAARLRTRGQLRARPPGVGTSIETPQLSVVVVNFCQWKNTTRLTRHLRRCEAARRGAAEVVVVDNGSPRRRAARNLRALSGVSVYLNGRNEGFARAVNRGSNLSRGEWVLLLNPDVSVPDGFLDDVLDAAQRWPARDPRAGVVGFQLLNRDGTRQASAGPLPTLWRTAAGMLRPRARRKCGHQPPAGRTAVPWVTGGCLLVRRDCFEQLRGLDESFFLYYEDVDFCLRAQDAGWSVWFDPALKVTHHFPLHDRVVPPPLRLVTRHALLTYSRKHWAGWKAAALARVVRAEAFARGALARRRGDAPAAGWYGALGDLARAHAAGRHAVAAGHVRRAADTLHAVAAAQDGRTR
jgi:N-acetylglucosaminyl-diphospho-decaprenol L-rhamnosyltransferase